jgi:hypothetical protein
MKSFLGLFIFCHVCFFCIAQRPCGTVQYTRQLAINHPEIEQGYAIAEQQILRVKNQSLSSRDTTAGELINIPVVIHILYNTNEQNISDAQVISQLDVLNKDYSYQNNDNINTPAAFKSFAADTRVRFCLAQVDPQGKRTNGIIRKYTGSTFFTTDDAMKSSSSGGDDAWDCTKYLNVWVCRLFGNSLGYATFPGGPQELDGVVVGYDVFGTGGVARYPYNKGRTATHEIGHWLGLHHLWGDADCGDDGVDDTPSQQTYNFGCPSFPHITSCSPNNNGDMFMNYMDFSDDGCMNMFTNGQKIRMRALFATGNMRNTFLSSFQCDSLLATGAAVPDIPVAVPVNPNQFKVYPNPVINNVTIEYNANNTLKISGKPISIYNVLGLKVYSSVLFATKTTINLSSLAAGIYLVETGQGATKCTVRLIRE